MSNVKDPSQNADFRSYVSQPQDSSGAPWTGGQRRPEYQHGEQERQSVGQIVPRRFASPLDWPDYPGALTVWSGPIEAPASNPHWFRQTMQYKRTIALVALLLAGPLILGIWLFMKPQYEAVGQIRVHPIIPRLVFRTEDNGTVPLYQSYLNTQVGVIRSPTVLQAALAQPEVQATAWSQRSPAFWRRTGPSRLERLQADLIVRPRGQTELIDVSIRTAAGADSAVIVNHILDEYINCIRCTSDEGSDVLFDQLTEKYDALKEEIDAHESAVAEVRKDLGTNNPQELVTRYRLRLDEMQAELAAVRRRLTALRKHRENMQKADDLADHATAGLPVAPELQVFQADPEWRQLHAALRTAECEVDIAGHQFGRAHPTMIAFVNRAALAKEMLSTRQAQLISQWELNGPVVTRSRGDGSVADVAIPVGSVELLGYEEELLATDLDGQRAAFERTFDMAETLTKELAVIQQKKELFDAVRRRLEQKRMERNVPGSITVLSRAIAPLSATYDRRMTLTVLVLFLGLGAGISVAFLRATGDPVITEAEELAQRTPGPFLAKLPEVSGRGGRSPLEDPALNEGIRMARVPLIERMAARRSNVVLVTSPGVGEGKTTTSVLLARSLAQCGKKVLLVDADLQNPGIARSLAIDAPLGFVDIITGRLDDSKVILETGVRGLRVLPSGCVAKGSDPELIAMGALDSTITAWRREYDVILLDSPPLLPVADTRILAAYADGAVLLAWAGRTRRADLLEAQSHLGLAGGMLWGILCVEPRRHSEYKYVYQNDYKDNASWSRPT